MLNAVINVSTFDSAFAWTSEDEISINHETKAGSAASSHIALTASSSAFTIRTILSH